MTHAVDLSALLSSAPRNCWLALDENATKIVGRGETVKDAMREAQAAGVDDPLIMWSPKEWIPMILGRELSV